MGPPAVLTTHLGVLLATRVLAASANAGFLAVGLLSGPAPRRPRPLVTLCLTSLGNGATFRTFTYLSPLVTDVTGPVPGVPALFGAGAFAG